MPPEPDNRASEPSEPSGSSDTFEPFTPSKPFIKRSQRFAPSERLDPADPFETPRGFGPPLPVPPAGDAGSEELAPLVGADPSEPRRRLKPGKRGWIALAAAAAVTGLVLVTIPLMDKDGSGSGSGSAKDTGAAGEQRQPGSGGPADVVAPDGGENGHASAGDGKGGDGTTDGKGEPVQKPGTSPGKGSNSGSDGGSGATDGQPPSTGGDKAKKPRVEKAPPGPADGGGSEIPRPPKLDDGKVKGQVMAFAANRCLDIVGAAVTDGTPLRLDACSGKARQRFEFRPDGKVWTLYQKKTCMDVSGGATADGTPVQIADCSSNAAQTFKLRTDGSLVNPRSGKCVEPVNLGGPTGFRLQLRTCDGGKNQKWQIG
ncbi:ricin-type beta-trefoil lectin domain protein [Streptomyces sp. NPDC058953]|uniref:ricin-type beta-trefoil lectin domain protein n=1 Tax=unclassified Streptomyces TaxID=2593676 RepID=UPI0036CB087D